jgi:FlaA1/EpsC-like NDP-sugar epimerase
MKRILIIGGGVAGRLLINDILNRKIDYEIVGVVDDNLKKGFLIYNDVFVLGKIDDISDIVTKKLVDEIIIAIPSERGKIIRKIVLSISCYKNVIIRLLPRISEIVLSGIATFDDVRSVDITDLVGENIIKKDQKKIEDSFRDKVVLVSGGGGSIGSELSKQIFLSKPKKIIIIDNCEKNLFYIDSLLKKIKENNKEIEIQTILGNINNTDLIESIFKFNNIDTVFHAAAYKHVPLLEENIYEAVNNNVLGTYNMCFYSGKYKVDKFILISTDKAVNPFNVMGKTKRIAELLLCYFNSLFKTKYTAVRFGNVFNSSGSAVEIFLGQIESNNPITITDPEMTRYFLTIPEAVHLILQAWYMAKKNSLFMLEMGEPVNILELAKCLAFIKGNKAKDMNIKIIGGRNGEKKHEILFNETMECRVSTNHKKIYLISTENKINFVFFDKKIKELVKIIELNYIKNHSEKGIAILNRSIKELIDLSLK